MKKKRTRKRKARQLKTSGERNLHVIDALEVCGRVNTAVCALHIEADIGI